MNKPQPGMRWRLSVAAAEFRIDDQTLSKRLKGLGIAPDEDGTFSTYDVCRAALGDLEREKIRLTSSQASRQEVALARERGEVADLEQTFQAMSNLLFAVRRTIEMSELPVDARDEIFEQMQKLDVREFIDQPDKPKGEPNEE